MLKTQPIQPHNPPVLAFSDAWTIIALTALEVSPQLKNKISAAKTVDKLRNEFTSTENWMIVALDTFAAQIPFVIGS